MSDNGILGSATQAVGQRTIMRNVYLWMTGGLTLTGVVALGVSSNPAFVRAIFSSPVVFIFLILAQLGIVIFLSARIMRMSTMAATASFIGYAALTGLTLSVIFLAYTSADITLAFFVAAGTFAGTSLYGLVTKRDLTGVGHYLGMALWGIIIASVINLLIGSSGLYYLISFVGVGVFVGLTAYDTQRIAAMSRKLSSTAGEADFLKLSILGALKLYLDFINLFLFLLRIFGRRR